MWSRRNKSIFVHDFARPHDLATVIVATAHSFAQGWADYAASSMRPLRRWKHIKWERPPLGTFKLNTDGAAMGNPGRAGAGGLIRDSEGTWVGGFKHNIGYSNSITAELWRVYSGLQLAWRMGCRSLIVEIDSQVVKDLLLQQTQVAATSRALIIPIQELLKPQWSKYRESNICADWLAKKAVSQSVGVHYCERPRPDRSYSSVD